WSIAASSTDRVSALNNLCSGQARGGTAQCPAAPKRSRSTVGSKLPSSSSEENGTERPSRCARVLAVLVRIRKIQVFSDDRPSNRLIPFRTPSQVSWTTSSATARLETYIIAT